MHGVNKKIYISNYIGHIEPGDKGPGNTNDGSRSDKQVQGQDRVEEPQMGGGSSMLS